MCAHDQYPYESDVMHVFGRAERYEHAVDVRSGAAAHPAQRVVAQAHVGEPSWAGWNAV